MTIAVFTPWGRHPFANELGFLPGKRLEEHQEQQIPITATPLNYSGIYF